MKKIFLLFIMPLYFMPGYSQDNPSYFFEINHYDYFLFNNSEPTEKQWTFELTITENGPEEFEVCYSKELVSCLFNLNSFRENKVIVGKKGLCFKYQLSEENDIKISDKTSILEEFASLKDFNSPDLEEELLNSLREEIEFLLEDENFLERELLREIALIHEYDYYEIPIGISGMTKNDKEIGLGEYHGREQEFLNEIKWKSTKKAEVYKTIGLNENEFIFDFISGSKVLTAKTRPDFALITSRFFQENFDINVFKNVTLIRDLRHFNKRNTKLTYLLKERLTDSPKMLKKTTLEIKKL